MATPLTADQFVNALRAEGVRVVTVGEWRTHNRNHKGAWGPVNGVMVHHTVSRGSAATVNLCYDGYASLPGPLCHGVITKDGTVHVISVGRSNHAGGGSPDVLAAVTDERYGDYPPATHHHEGTPGAVDGNARFYGWECENMGDGVDPWPAAQVEAIVRASAAVCRAYGWSAKSVIGHKEWSDYKSDPKGPGSVVAMPNLRAKIQERLTHPASWSPTAPVPTTPQGPDMAPNLTVLSRPEDVTLLQDIPYTVYWTAEHTDTANEHGAGGKTVLTAGSYTAAVNLTLDGLLENEWVDVYPVEEDTTGAQLGAGFVHKVRGWGDGSLPPVEETVSIVGAVGQRLAIQIVSRSETPVTLKQAWISVQHWN